MAWNEPGNDEKDKSGKPEQTPDKDPWSGQKQKPNRPRDLDDALKQLQQKFAAVMGGKKGGNGGSAIKGGLFGLILLALAIFAIWVAMGFFVVQPPEQAVVLRFGKYVETLSPGLHWIPRFVESAEKVNIQKMLTYTYPSSEAALMLTQDQNIVAVAITVQFRVNNPRDYLFNVVNPINSLQQATASALRQVVGQMNLDAILTTGREDLRNRVKSQLVEILGRYQTGLNVVNVLLKTAQAPDAVRDAFDDAVKAQEDEKRYQNQAQAYAMRVEPIAKGQAKRILEAAQAYKQKVVLQAQGQIAAFLALLPEYKKAPEVTRERLYIESIESVLRNSSKILVDSTGTNLLYLPLNQFINQSVSKVTVPPDAESIVPLPPQSSRAFKSIAPIKMDTSEGVPAGYGIKGEYP